MGLEKQARRSQAERRGEAEARLLEAAIVLVAERGYDGFSLAELGERANFSRGLPSHYFGSKANLLAAVAKKIINDFIQLRQSPDDSPSTFDRLEEIVWRYIGSTERRQPQTRALHAIVGAALFNPELRPMVQEMNDLGRGVIRTELRKGMMTGDVASDIKPDAEALVFLAFLRGVALLYLVDGTIGIREAAQEFLLAFRRRLAAPITSSEKAASQAPGA